MIIRYLARTHDTGIIISSFFGDLFLRCYVDTNFANLFQIDCPEDSTSANSHTSFITSLRIRHHTIVVIPFGNHINRLKPSHQHLKLNILYSVQHSVSLYHISIFTAKQSVFSMSLPSSKQSSTMPVLSSKTTMAPWHLYNIKRLRLIPSILTSRWNHFDNMSKIIAFQLKRHL